MSRELRAQRPRPLSAPLSVLTICSRFTRLPYASGVWQKYPPTLRLQKLVAGLSEVVLPSACQAYTHTHELCPMFGLVVTAACGGLAERYRCDMDHRVA
jgi:hypothetical protein